TITKLAKTCTLDLTPNKRVSMWCEENFFDEFQMEGMPAEHNEIYLALTMENLSKALKTAQNAKTVKIKLTDKHCPCLTVAVDLVRSDPLPWAGRSTGVGRGHKTPARYMIWSYTCTIPRSNSKFSINGRSFL
uniref:Uncharacterized protein n=1 Tax=Crocodylus porosus TaxID=8502 RepID=A0A7M4FB58_CROPO